MKGTSMNCTVKSIFLIGIALGILIFLMGYFGLFGSLFFYISGWFLADLYINNSGQGEAGIVPGIFIALFTSIITSIFYSFILCKFFGKRKTG